MSAVALLKNIGLKNIGLVALALTAAGAAQAASYNFTLLDYGAAGTGTSALGINDDGAVVGYYNAADGMHGFLYRDGAYTDLNAGAAAGTIATDIANDGRVIGTYENGSESRGFFYDGSTYTLFDAGGDGARTTATGISPDGGRIVGYVVDDSGIHGFSGTTGSTDIFDYPGNTGTFAQGINNAGQTVGSFYQNGIPSGQGFLYSNGAFTALQHPDAVFGTSAWGINDDGLIVGSFIGELGVQGFIYDGATYTPLTIPGATDISLLDINTVGQIVGTFLNENGRLLGFIATPVIPVPASAWLFGSALLGLSLRAVRRRSRTV